MEAGSSPVTEVPPGVYGTLLLVSEPTFVGRGPSLLLLKIDMKQTVPLLIHDETETVKFVFGKKTFPPHVRLSLFMSKHNSKKIVKFSLGSTLVLINLKSTLNPLNMVVKIPSTEYYMVNRNSGNRLFNSHDHLDELEKCRVKG